MPEVSVIMPVHNGEKFLVECLEGLIGQTYTDFEIIVVNDGSTDSSLDILQEYQKRDQRIHILSTGKNSGVAAACNLGASYCSGKYIARQDADDISHSFRFEVQVSYMERNPDVLACGTNIYAINCIDRKECHPTVLKKLESVEHDLNQEYENNNYFKKRFLSVPFAHGTAMIRRDIFQMLGGYREQFKACEDYDLWLRISEHGPIHKIPRKLYYYRIHPMQSIQLKSKLMFVEKQIAIASAIQRTLTSKGHKIENIKIGVIGYGPECPEIINGLKQLGYSQVTLYYNRKNDYDPAQIVVPALPARMISRENLHFAFVADLKHVDAWCRFLEAKGFARGRHYMA